MIHSIMAGPLPASGMTNCPSMPGAEEGFPGYGTFSFKNGKISGKPEQVGHPAQRPSCKIYPPPTVYHPSRGPTTPRTGVSCIAGRFFTSWATREVPREWYRCIEGPFESHMWPSFLGQSTEHPFLNHIKHQPLFLFGSEFVPSTAVRPMQSWL